MIFRHVFTAQHCIYEEFMQAAQAHVVTSKIQGRAVKHG